MNVDVWFEAECCVGEYGGHYVHDFRHQSRGVVVAREHSDQNCFRLQRGALNRNVNVCPRLSGKSVFWTACLVAGCGLQYLDFCTAVCSYLDGSGCHWQLSRVIHLYAYETLARLAIQGEVSSYAHFLAIRIEGFVCGRGRE